MDFAGVEGGGAAGAGAEAVFRYVVMDQECFGGLTGDMPLPLPLPLQLQLLLTWVPVEGDTSLVPKSDKEASAV